MSVLKSKPRSFRPQIESLESRLVLTSVCNANPVYAAECAYVDSLVQSSQATITAVQSGNWSDPATWGGRTPTTGDNVWIPNDIAVVVDSREPGALRSVLDNGILSFAPTANTSLTVNTLITGTDGELDIGTAANPIQAGVTADLIFADSQSVIPGLTQAQLFPTDTQEMSGGLISQGTLNIYGAQLTPYVNMANAAAGDTSLNLASTPTGWKTGDTVLIAGDKPEEATIAAITDNVDGTATVTLSAPLQYTHSCPAGQTLQVMDENRSVLVQDEGTSTQYMDGSDGMVMSMHQDAVHMEYAEFTIPGRTDKSVPLGSILPNGTINHVARYSVHFHRDYWPGFTDNDPAIQVIGCFQKGGVGWGYDNHDSNVDFINDVAYNDFGSGFTTEAGNELGSFQGCIALAVPGVPNSTNLLALRTNDHDFGWNGSGFWLMSPETTLTGNYVYDSQIGYAYFGQPLNQGPLGVTKLFSGGNPQTAALAPFTDNTAGGCGTGLILWYREPTNSEPPDTIDHFTSWDTGSIGIGQTYSFHTNIVDPVLLAAPGALAGIRCNAGGYSFFMDVTGADVEGFQDGYITSSVSVNHVTGGYWDDATAFYLPSVNGPRYMQFTGPITFGSHVQTEYYTQSLDAAHFISNPGDVGYINFIFLPDFVILPDGQQLFAANQAPAYVPFPAGTTMNLPSFLVGLTNRQIWDQYGMALGGMVASADAVTDPSTNGLVGTAYPLTPQFRVMSPSTVASAASGYTPTWITYDPTTNAQLSYTTAAPVQLNVGWNAVTETVNGQKHTWLVYARS